ncbi:MAG TPA: hypothetical protein VK796_07480 [Cytophaga sp.]|jgi:hypothetical protein|nr:hypothetical protein [Cytophaga sp.]
MTKKDFFIIIIKLFGLYTVITTLFSVIPSMLALSQMGFDAYGYIYALSSIGFFALVFIYLLNHSEKVVTFLKLDQGFDSDVIQIEKLDKVQLIQLGLIIVGGLIFLEHLPSLLTNCFYFYKALSQDSIDYGEIEFSTTGNYAYLTTDFISVLLGYLVFTNHEKLAKRFV